MALLRILSWLLLSAACLLWAAALGFVALWPQHPTSARQLRWRDANGQPLASAPSTCGQDTRFPLLVQQNRVWLPCPAAPDLPGGTILPAEPPPSGQRPLPSPATADGSRLVPLSRALPEQGSGALHGLRRLTGALLSACYLSSTLPLIPWLLPLLS